MTKIYAGVGSRKAPKEVLEILQETARHLDFLGWRLRSGHAEGCDYAFECGSNGADIFLPWKGFNGHLKKFKHHTYNVVSGDLELDKLMVKCHPLGYNIADKPTVVQLMRRTTANIAGYGGIAKVDLVLCWTDDGTEKGGTGQAIRVAKELGIPVCTLYGMEKFDSEWIDRIIDE